jgi:hypothetical protein
VLARSDDLRFSRLARCRVLSGYGIDPLGSRPVESRVTGHLPVLENLLANHPHPSSTGGGGRLVLRGTDTQSALAAADGPDEQPAATIPNVPANNTPASICPRHPPLPIDAIVTYPSGR